MTGSEAKLYKEWIDNDRNMRTLIAQMRKVASKAGKIRLAEARGCPPERGSLKERSST